MKGEAPRHVVADRVGIDFDDLHEATIGGHVVEALGRLPAAGEIVELDGHRVKITGVDETRITELLFPSVETRDA